MVVQYKVYRCQVHIVMSCKRGLCALLGEKKKKKKKNSTDQHQNTTYAGFTNICCVLVLVLVLVYAVFSSRVRCSLKIFQTLLGHCQVLQFKAVLCEADIYTLAKSTNVVDIFW